MLPGIVKGGLHVLFFGTMRQKYMVIPDKAVQSHLPRLTNFLQRFTA